MHLDADNLLNSLIKHRKSSGFALFSAQSSNYFVSKLGAAVGSGRVGSEGSNPTRSGLGSSPAT